MKFVIDRQRWLRGEGSENSYLLRPNDGKMCCLGFFGLACGILERDLEGRSEPGQPPSGFPLWLVDGMCSKDATLLIHLNDFDLSEPYRWNQCILSIRGVIGLAITTETEREARIAEIFAKHGVEVEFVN